MPRFFAEEADLCDGKIRLGAKNAYHIARSLRMALGDEVSVCLPDGREYRCVLTHIRDEECLCRVSDSRPAAGEPPVPTTLYIALPKGDKLEFIVQKAVELGATRIVPFLSCRCVRRPPQEREQHQIQRLRRIAESAAMQCLRGRIPDVAPIFSFEQALSDAATHELPLFCYEGEGTIPLSRILREHPSYSSVCALIGSEGGFSREEACAAREAGLIATGLGSRILRCETAPVFVLSVLAFHSDMS